MAKRVEKIQRVCEHCGSAFSIPPCVLKTSPARFCTFDCFRGFYEPAAQLRRLVDRSGGDDACWPWMGSRDEEGYGQLWYRNKRLRAHREAWSQSAEQPAPDDLVIRHRCPGGPNTWCCNPRHLKIGTVADNNHDTIADGHAAIGERSGKTTLTDTTVFEIRQRRASGESRNALAKEFGVTRSCIAHIVQGRVWRHVPMPTASRLHVEVTRA